MCMESGCGWGMVPETACNPPDLDLLGVQLGCGSQILPSPNRVVEAFPSVAWLPELAPLEEPVSPLGHKP